MISDDSWRGLYRLLAAFGLPRPVTGEYGCALSWPDLQMALLAPGNVPTDEAAEWTLFRLDQRELSATLSLIETLEQIAFQATMEISTSKASLTVSATEARLLEALIKAGLPVPDRNREFRDAANQVVTVPDFCWEEAHLAVEVDGHFYHGGGDLRSDIMRAAAKNPRRKKQLESHAKRQAAKDAAKRRFLAQMGWTVMVVSDTEIDAGRSEAIAQEVLTTYHHLLSERPTTASA